MCHYPMNGEMKMTVKKTFTINEQNSAFIDREVKNGEFNSGSEMVRTGLRLLEEQQLKLAELRHEVDKGFNSYQAGNYTSYSSAEALAKDIIER